MLLFNLSNIVHSPYFQCLRYYFYYYQYKHLHYRVLLLSLQDSWELLLMEDAEALRFSLLRFFFLDDPVDPGDMMLPKPDDVPPPLPLLKLDNRSNLNRLGSDFLDFFLRPDEDVVVGVVVLFESIPVLLGVIGSSPPCSFSITALLTVDMEVRRVALELIDSGFDDLSEISSSSSSSL